MTPEKRLEVLHYARAFMYIFFACAYVSGVVLFIVMYENYWASGGFSLVIALILVRLWLFLMPKEKLYVMFPVMSWKRALWQSTFFALFLAGLGVGLWLFARGLQKRQNWKGDSYFCSMTGVLMAAKWAMFVVIPIKELRPDLMNDETLNKIRALMANQGLNSNTDDSEVNEPYAEADPSNSNLKRMNAAVSTV